MEEALQCISGIIDRLPDIPRAPDSTQRELRAVKTRNNIINVAQNEISWDPKAVSNYFEVCCTAYNQSHLKLVNIKASIRRCRGLRDQAGIRRRNLLRGTFKQEGASEVKQQQILYLQECVKEIQTRCMEIAKIQKQWIYVRRLNWILAQTAMFNMAYLKAGELGDLFLETGTEKALKRINEHLAETRRMKTSLLIMLYDALEWARLDQRDIVAEATTVIENLPW